MYTDFRNILCGKLAAVSDIYNEFGTIMSNDAVIDINGRKLLNFRNPDSLGLSNSFAVESARQTANQQDNTSLTRTLENEIAQNLSTKDCITYSSANDAYCAIVNHLLGRADAVIYGSFSHFAATGSPVACRPTKYKYHEFDLEDIEKQLKLSQAQPNRLLIIDAVNIATGCIVPLNRILALADKYKAIVAIDETDTMGLIGDKGQGICNLFGIEDCVEIHIGSLGNLGCNGGAYIAAKQEIVDWMRQQPATVSHVPALPQSEISAAVTALSIAEQMNNERQYLLQITNYFIKKLYCLGFNIPPTQSATFAVTTDNSAKAEHFSAALAHNGVLVSTLASPFVGKEQARLIVKLSIKHTQNDIEHAADIFKATAHEINFTQD